MNFDLTGVGQVVFNLLSDAVCQEHHCVFANLFANLFGLNHYADFAAGLDGEGFFNTVKATSDFLKLLETLNVVFEVINSKYEKVVNATLRGDYDNYNDKR